MVKEVSSNKKAYHDYEITDRYEAGIVLTGAEIKAIRAGKVNLTGSHARILHGAISHSPFAVSQNQKVKGQWLKANSQKLIAKSQPELFLINMHIGIKEGDPTKTRKLLMHRSEIDKLIGKTQIKGLTLIPTRLYLKKGRAKIELGLGRGKKLHDKRETIKKRDLERSRKFE